jgi:hypothetical protein
MRKARLADLEADPLFRVEHGWRGFAAWLFYRFTLRLLSRIDYAEEALPPEPVPQVVYLRPSPVPPSPPPPEVSEEEKEEARPKRLHKGLLMDTLAANLAEEHGSRAMRYKRHRRYWLADEEES